MRDRANGSRHLRVGITLRARSVEVESIWVVEQPVVQRSRLRKPILARIDVRHEPVLIEAFDDPREVRGVCMEDVGHSRLTEETGVVYVSIPFTDRRELSHARVRLFDADRADLPTTTATGILELLDDPPETLRRLGEIDASDLRTSPDWVDVGRELGLPVDPGRFELYRDRADRYRWRLRRIDGEIVACSGQGFDSREACETEVRWIRDHADSSTVESRDV